MKDSLGIIFLHIITIQWNMLYPAALGIQQVCSWRQGEDIGSGGGSNRWWHTTIVNA